MSVYHGDLFKRKRTGGKGNPSRGKRKYEMGRPPVLTKIGGDSEVKEIKVKGGGLKIRVIEASHANVALEGGKVIRSKILDVIDNPANREFVRMKIVTRGAVIKTEAGNAIVTSKPGANGVINAKLVLAK